MKAKLTGGSLFAGIGGFDLGFERAGIKTVWQVEIDPKARLVLAQHFPEAERFEDVRTVGARNLGWVDVIFGGFPCQDISNAGYRAGIDGEQSGLWSEMFRIISELRPRIVCVENVSALLVRGIERVLGDLAEIGYDAEWDTFRADEFGAPQMKRSYAERSEVEGQMDTLAQWAVRMSGLKHARLVPDLWEWVMGFPQMWTDFACSVTPSCHKSQNGSVGE